MRGALIPKSCVSDWLKMANFSLINSCVKVGAIWLTGMCPVTKATRKSPFIRIINAWSPFPKRCSMYSV